MNMNKTNEGEETKLRARLMAEPCKLFPDGVHAIQIVQNTSPLFLRIARLCPCGATVMSRRLDIKSFMEGDIPVLVEVDELGVPIANAPEVPF